MHLVQKAVLEEKRNWIKFVFACVSLRNIPKSRCTCLGTPATVLRLLSFRLLWSKDCEWTSEQRTLASLSKPTPAMETAHLRNLCLVATAEIPSLTLTLSHKETFKVTLGRTKFRCCTKIAVRSGAKRSDRTQSSKLFTA